MVNAVRFFHSSWAFLLKCEFIPVTSSVDNIRLVCGWTRQEVNSYYDHMVFTEYDWYVVMIDAGVIDLYVHNAVMIACV